MIAVPAHQRLYGDLDARYHHVRRYSRHSVANVFTRAGLSVDTVRYFNPLGAIGWLVFVRWMRHERLTPATVWMTEHLLVPIGRVLDALRFRPFGQSVIATGRRLA
jgi:hypothetical protein